MCRITRRCDALTSELKEKRPCEWCNNCSTSTNRCCYAKRDCTHPVMQMWLAVGSKYYWRSDCLFVRPKHCWNLAQNSYTKVEVKHYLGKAQQSPEPGWCGPSRSTGWQSRPWHSPAPVAGCASRSAPPPGWCSRPGAPPCPSDQRCRRRWSWRGWRTSRGPARSSSTRVQPRNCRGSRGSRSLLMGRSSSHRRPRRGLQERAHKKVEKWSVILGYFVSFVSSVSDTRVLNSDMETSL